tara:strand:- start:783 stop:1232 length:450 start_codon:yes stop_codon:yes gene_type:complete
LLYFWDLVLLSFFSLFFFFSAICSAALHIESEALIFEDTIISYSIIFQLLIFIYIFFSLLGQASVCCYFEEAGQVKYFQRRFYAQSFCNMSHFQIQIKCFIYNYRPFYRATLWKNELSLGLSAACFRTKEKFYVPINNSFSFAPSHINH